MTKHVTSSLLPTPHPIFTQHAHWVDAKLCLRLDREPSRVWTLPNAQSEPPKLPMALVHRGNAFLEDAIHDYVWLGSGIRLHRRHGLDKGLWVIVEYDDTPTGYVLEVWAKDETGKVIECKTKEPIADLRDALAEILATTNKIANDKAIVMVDGEAKIYRLGPDWKKDMGSYGTRDQRAEGTLKLRKALHAAFPKAKDASAFDWNGEKVGEEWQDVKRRSYSKKKEVSNHANRG